MAIDGVIYSIMNLCVIFFIKHIHQNTNEHVTEDLSKSISSWTTKGHPNPNQYKAHSDPDRASTACRAGSR